MKLGSNEIKKLIPHRSPFLFIDECEILEKGKKGIASRVFKDDEYFFQGHFPSTPVMPGVLIIEAMAQTSALLVVHTLGREANGKLVYFMSIDGARFRKPVIPGDQLQIQVVKRRNRGNVWKFACEVRVGDGLVAEALITAMISDAEAGN